jgi:hypothetical protein
VDLANTTLKSLNEKICQFYGHPAMKKDRNGYSADRLAGFALDCILSSETKLGIIDDVHFITPRRKDGQDVINHLKFLNSEFPITFLFSELTTIINICCSLAFFRRHEGSR